MRKDTGDKSVNRPERRDEDDENQSENKILDEKLSKDDFYGSNDLKINDENLVDFLQTDFGDTVTMINLNSHFAKRNVKNAHYFVENERNGSFIRAYNRYGPGSSLKTHASVGKHHHHRRNRLHHSRLLRVLGGQNNGEDKSENESDDDEYEDAWTWSELYQDIDGAVVLMIQGILAGLTWLDAFNLAETKDTFFDTNEKELFSCTYSKVSDRTRELFFLLLNFSLVGVMKKFGKLTNERNATRSSQGIEHFSMCEVFSFWIDFPYILLQGSLGLYVLALIALLIGSPATMGLRNAQVQFQGDWCAVNIDSQLYQKSIGILRNVALTNVCLVSLAWACSCLETYLSMSKKRKLVNQLDQVYRQQIATEQKMERFLGKELEFLTTDQLKELIRMHQTALDSTQSMLVAKLQAISNTGGTSATIG